MLGKLIKYDFKATWRLYGIVYCAIIFSSILVSITNFSLEDVIHLNNYLKMFAIFALTISIFAVMIAFIVSCVKIFYQDCFTKQGYMTLSLPVKSEQLILSKLIVTIIWMFVTFIVCLFALFIILVLNDLVSLPELFNSIAREFMMIFGHPLDLIKGIYYIITAVSLTALTAWFSITITHIGFLKKGKNVISVIIYFLMNYLIGLLMDFLSQLLFNQSYLVYNYYSNTNVYLFCSTISLIICIGLFFLTAYLLKEKVDLE